MWPDRVSNPGPLTNESGALPTALRGPVSAIEEPLNRFGTVMSNNTSECARRGWGQCKSSHFFR